MGFAIAESLAEQGTKVFLITGPVSEKTQNPNIQRIDVVSAEEMYKESLKYFSNCDIAIMAAAVADYRTDKPFPHKLKKSDKSFQLELVRNPDILHTLGERKGQRFLVGFAAETEKFEENALRKIKEKHLDLIVVNDVSRTDAGFEVDTNQIMLIDKYGKIRKYPLQSKEDAANAILDKILKLQNKKIKKR